MRFRSTRRLRTVAVAAAALSLAVVAPAGAAERPEAGALLRRAYTAAGGSALARVRATHRTVRTRQSGLDGVEESWNAIGGDYSAVFRSPVGDFGEGDDGVTRWSRDPSGIVRVEDGPESRVRRANERYFDSHALWSADRGGASVAYAGERSDGGTAYGVVTVTPPGGAATDLWFDAKSARLARRVDAVGTVGATTTYSDYRVVRGVAFAFHSRTVTTSGDSEDDVTTNLVVNPGDVAAHLTRPASTAHDFDLGGAAEATVPFELPNDNHVYVDVMLNGRGPFHFIFDTGGVNYVDSGVAAALGLQSAGALRGGGVGDATELVGLTRVASLAIGPVTLRDQLFVAAPVRAGFGISLGNVDGLIGYEVLARLVTTFDYGRHVLVFRLPDGGAAPSDATPLTFDEQTPQVACRVAHVAGVCTLDTGDREAVSIYSPFLAANPAIVPPGATAVGANGFGVGGIARGRLGRLDSLEFGGVSVSGAIADFSTQKKGAFGNPYDAANIGGGALKRFNITFDYPDRRVSFVPNAGYGEPETYDRSGVFLVRATGGLTVADVRPGTPAAASGVLTGDVLVAVDGTPTATMSLPDVRALFMRAPQTTLRLTLRAHDGTTRDVNLVLRDYV